MSLPVQALWARARAIDEARRRELASEFRTEMERGGDPARMGAIAWAQAQILPGHGRKIIRAMAERSAR